MLPGGHLSVILVVIIGFRQWGVRKGQNMAQTWPRLYIYTKLLALKPSRGPYLVNRSRIPEKTQINWRNGLGSISGDLEPFRGLYRAPKPTVLH